MWHKLSFALLFAVLTCGQIAFAHIRRDGKCNGLKIQKDFKWPDFSGVWYEHARYPNLTEFGEKCVYRNYTQIGNNTYEIKISGLLTSNEPVSSDATGIILAPGLLYVDFAGARQIDQILDTDYKSWAVIYSCRNVRKHGAKKAWILIRKRNADAHTVRKAEEMLAKNNFPTKNLRDTMQYGCAN